MTPRTAAASVPPLAIFGTAVTAIGLAGGLFTLPDAWSAALIRPVWHPPTWIFGPAWSIVLLCVALGSAASWTELATERDRKSFLVLLGFNAIFNLAWSPVFYLLRRPDIALVAMAFLWISIAACIAFLIVRAPRPASFFAPYLIWITIAWALNFEIVRLNAPF